MKQITFGLLTALAIGINTAFWFSLKQSPRIFAENGPMENFQAVCLGLSSLLWLIAGFVSRNRFEKTLLLSLAVFNFSFMIHEFDTRKFDAPVLEIVLNGRIRDAWLGALWLACVIFFFKNARPVWNQFLEWIKSPSGILMIVSGVFWVVSGLNDKAILLRKNLFYEELAEVNSTLLMLLAALLFLLIKKTDRQWQNNDATVESKPQS